MAVEVALCVGDNVADFDLVRHSGLTREFGSRTRLQTDIARRPADVNQEPGPASRRQDTGAAFAKRASNAAEDRLMRRLGFVYGELVGRYPDDFAVLPFDHRQAQRRLWARTASLTASCIAASTAWFSA